MALQRKYRAAIIGCGRIASDFDDDPLMVKSYGISTHAGAYTENSGEEGNGSFTIGPDYKLSSLRVLNRAVLHIKDQYVDPKRVVPKEMLLAGLDYSIHKYVVYAAAKPPRSVFRNIADRFGRTIVYLPVGQLSPTTLKKLRVVHVLDGYDKRDIAKDYIW